MLSACAGCQKPSALLTNTSFCHFCRRPFQTGYSKKRHQCKHRASHFKVSAKRRGPEKLVETDQNSQPDGPPGDMSPPAEGAAGLSDYLHFARLIGERPAEAAKTLSSNQIKYEVDAAAENYLERWQADEEPAYSTFEAMLGQGAGSSKLQKAKGRVPVNDDHVQFAKEAVADAQKAKQKDGRAIRSLLKAKAPAPGLARPPRLPPGSGGASTAKPSRQDQPTLMSRPKPPATDENRWLDTASDVGAESTGLDVNTPNLPPALSYTDFDLLIGNFKKKRKKSKKSPPQEKPAPPLQAQRPSRTTAVVPDSPAVPAVPAVRPRSEVPAPPSLEAKPSTWTSSQPTAPKASRQATTAAAQAPEVSLLAPPRGFQDERAPKSPKKSEDKPAPSLVARPVAPPAPPVAVQDRTEQQATSADVSTRRSETMSSAANKGTSNGSVAAPGNGSEQSVQAAATATSSSNGLPAVVAPSPPRLPSSVPAMQRPKLPTSPSLASATHLAPMPPVQRPQRSSSSSSIPDNVAETASQEAAVAKDAQADLGLKGPSQPSLAPESPSEPSLASGNLQKPTRPNTAPNGQPASAQPAPAGRAIDRSQAQVRAGSKQLAARRNQAGAQSTASRSVAEPASRPSANGASRQKVELSARPIAEIASCQDMKLSSRPDRSGAGANKTLPSSQVGATQILPSPQTPPKQPSKPSLVLAERPSMPPASSSESSEVKFAHRFGKMMTLESSVLSLAESLKFAQRLKDEERQLPVVVVAANAGGVLVTNRMFKAFMPLQEMTSVMGFQVLSVDAELRKAAGVEGEIDRQLAGSIRRKAMRTLRGSTTTAKVIAVDMTARGSNVGIIMSCKQNVAGRSHREEHVYQELPQEHIDILQQNLGTTVQGTVVGVRPYGSFVAFDVEAASGTVLEVYGMVHLSEIAWDFCKDARLAVKQAELIEATLLSVDPGQQGQVIEAKLLSIDPSSCKVWLSMRQVHPDPLQETLDSLLSGDLSTFGDTDSTPQILGESTSADELAEGEMIFPEAEEVARSLALLLDVDSVQPGRFGTADPPVRDLQVYLAKPDLQRTVSAAAPTDGESEEYDQSDSDSESDDTEGIDSDDDDDYEAGSDSTETAIAATAQKSAETLAEDPSVESLVAADDSLIERSSTATSTDNGCAVLMQAVGTGSGRAISKADAPRDSSSIMPGAEVVNDEASLSEGTSTDALPEDATRLDATAGEEDDDDDDVDVDLDELSALFGWVDDCDSTVCTLVVQKGQHQQELLVSGGITRQQLTHEVDSIVASLNAAQDDGLATSS